MKDIQLYPDQEEFIGGIRKALRDGHKSVLGVASCGFGKTMTSAFIAREALRRGKTVWFVCHLKNLLYQTSQAFWSLGIEHGMIASGKGRSYLPAQVAIIGTLVRRLGDLKAPDILISDESHLAMGAGWQTVIDWAKERGSIVIGNSASPERLDGKGLGYLFETMVEARPMSYLIEQGRLSDYVMYAPTTVNLEGVKTSMGDYNKEQLETEMDRPVLTGNVVSHWKRLAQGKRTVCYCVSIKHSQHVVEQFNESGIPAVHVDGTTPAGELKEAIQGFADGKYLVMSNASLITTGFDLSAQVGRDVTIEACILLRPTQSVALYIQMVGRALRKKPYPAIILDHAGCAMKHGLPCDERSWTLEGKKKGKGRKKEDEEQALSTVQCPAPCFTIFRRSNGACPSCGKPIEGGGRRDLEVVDGELEKLDKDALRRERKAEQGSARTLRDLVELGMRRGMKKPAAWAASVMSARTGSGRPKPADFKAANDMMAEIKSGKSQSQEAF